MSDLAFSIVGAGVDRYSASPSILLRVRVTESTGLKVDAIALRAQIQIEVQRRHYLPAESELLTELFGEPSRYAQTLKPMLWAHAAQMVLAFEKESEFDLPIACSYDFEVASHKYLASLKSGVIPMNVMFGGMVFVQGAAGVTPEFVPWTCEARYQLPVTLWREAMDAFFPNSAWIRIDRELFDDLRRFKSRTGAPTWDAALERLCDAARAGE